jgi:hypothetical protein
LDEEKSKHVDLAQQNGFGPEFLDNLLRWVKGTKKKENLKPAREKRFVMNMMI